MVEGEKYRRNDLLAEDFACRPFSFCVHFRGMFAVVDMKGFQERVAEGQKIRIPRLSEDAGAKVVFNQVLLLARDSTVTVGTPNVAGATVEAKVLAHTRGDKIRVVKQRRRKRYRRVKGHRQEYTEIEIVKIAG